MNRCRSFIVFLLTVALPYAAAASVGEGLRCHHAGMHALVTTATPTHHHATMQHARDATSQAHHAAGPTSHDRCDCPVQCDCAQHCAGTGSSAVLPSHAPAIATGSDGQLIAGYAALIREAWHSPAFRPPIAALPSAA